MAADQFADPPLPADRKRQGLTKKVCRALTFFFFFFTPLFSPDSSKERKMLVACVSKPGGLRGSNLGNGDWTAGGPRSRCWGFAEQKLLIIDEAMILS